jgi:hypothetical protein
VRSAASRIDNRHPLDPDPTLRRDKEGWRDFLDDDVTSTALAAKMAERMQYYEEERKTVHLHIHPHWKRKLSTGRNVFTTALENPQLQAEKVLYS